MTLVLGVYPIVQSSWFLPFSDGLGRGQGQWFQVLLGPWEEEVHSQDTKPEMASCVRAGYFSSTWDQWRQAGASTEWGGIDLMCQSPEVNQSAKEAVTELSFLRAPVNFWLIGPNFISRNITSPHPHPPEMGESGSHHSNNGFPGCV